MLYGDIYLVDFEPSIGHEYKKERPAVIIQSDEQLRKSNLITIMPLTSKVSKQHSDDILVHKNSQNKLFSDSIVKVHSITSFDRKRFNKRVGKMDESILKQIRKYLEVHFDL